jgi:hypothetical protein
MMLPQIIILVLLAMGLGISLVQSGKPKTGTHSFWVQAISTTITLAILYWGGFFNVFFGG